HMGKQAGSDRAVWNRRGRQRRLHCLDVLSLVLTVPADIGRSFDGMNKQTGRAVVEPLGHIGANAHPYVAAARASLLRLGDIDYVALTRQVGRTLASTVTAALVGYNLLRRRFGRYGRLWRLRLGAAVKEG